MKSARLKKQLKLNNKFIVVRDSDGSLKFTWQKFTGLVIAKRKKVRDVLRDVLEKWIDDQTKTWRSPPE